MINDVHRAFMQEVVALARKHQVGAVNVGFRLNFQATRESGKDAGQVTGTWSEGRHGDLGHITMRYEEVVQMKEESRNADAS